MSSFRLKAEATVAEATEAEAAEIYMKRVALVVLICVTAACAQATPEQQVIDDAVEAMGGADRIRDLKALTIQGTGTAPNAGQNRMPDDDLPVWRINEYTRRIDVANSRMRVQQ